MTSQEFKDAYNSKKMYAYTQDEERCHIGTAPTLDQAIHTHGRACILQVIDELMMSLVNFTSAKVRLSEDQRQRLAWVILTQYAGMRITELILFVVKAQAGHFGKFYATIDPIDITTALHQWWGVCAQQRNAYKLARLEREQQRERDQREREYEANKTEIRTILLNGQYTWLGYRDNEDKGTIMIK